MQIRDRRIVAVDISRGGEVERVLPGLVVDCSGSAAVSTLAGIPVFEKDESDQVPAIVVPLSNVSVPLESTADRLQILLAIRHAIDDGILEKGSEMVSLMPALEPGRVLLKLNLGHKAMRQPSVARQHCEQLAAFLKRSVAGFEQCKPVGDAATIAHRASRRMVGEVVLTGDDVLQARSVPDRVADGCWPIEKWLSTGEQELVALPAGKCYTIPAGALRSAHLDNLLGAGRIMSADADAIASARVVGCCLATGEAAGNLAADVAETGSAQAG